MTLSEVGGTIALVAKGVDSTRKIIAAVRDARAYLRRQYPGYEDDLSGLLQEMRSTLVGLAKVSDVITEFRFTVVGDAVDFEPSRFNKEVTDRKQHLVALKSSVRTLRGSSGKTKDYAEALTKRADKMFWQLMDFLTQGSAKSGELSQQFNDLWVVDQRIVKMLDELIGAAQKALSDTSAALGPNQDPANVPKAAKVLAEYATLFKKLEDDCNELAEQFQDEIDDLNKERPRDKGKK